MSYVQNNSKQSIRYVGAQQSIQRSLKPRVKDNRYFFILFFEIF